MRRGLQLLVGDPEIVNVIRQEQEAPVSKIIVKGKGERIPR